MLLIFIFILFAFFTHAVVLAAEVAGVPRVVDGDTLVIGTTKVRLQGVDAPRLISSASMAMVVRGPAELRPVIVSPRTLLAGIVCSSRGLDAYRRMLGVCGLRGEDLNAWLVREGWALLTLRIHLRTRRPRKMHALISVDYGKAVSLRRGTGVTVTPRRRSSVPSMFR